MPRVMVAADYFNRANIGADWTVHSGSGTLVDNALKPNANNSKLYYSAATPEDDQYVQAVMKGTGWRSLYIRVSAGVNIGCYALGVSMANGSLRIWRVFDGTWGAYIDNGGVTVGPYTGGQVMRFEAHGQNTQILLKAYWEGELVRTLKYEDMSTPTIHNSGFCGCNVNSANTAIFDDWECGNIVKGNNSIRRTMRLLKLHGRH